MTERELLLAGCENAPGDRTALLVAADWMAEHGDLPWEAALRWMAKYDRYPHRHVYPDEAHEQQPNKHPWMWTCFGGLNEGLPHAALPRLLCTRIRFREWRCYQTWTEAVAGLADALAQGDVLCVGDPHKVEPNSPAEFEVMMRHAIDGNDEEESHRNADRLMCDLLRSLGYGEAVERFLASTRWYA